MTHFDVKDFDTPEGRATIVKLLNQLVGWRMGVNTTLHDLIAVNKDELVAAGKAYAKPENLNY